jgi:transcriptional regulator
VQGTLTVRDDERFVRGLVARLTRRHEAAEPRPWKMSDAPPDFVDTLLRNIVGIEVDVLSMVGKSKLSQNKEARDRLGAADTLGLRGHAELPRRDAGGHLFRHTSSRDPRRRKDPTGRCRIAPGVRLEERSA